MSNVLQNVRVRIAPSPTGFLHIGLARTALFNYLFAKRHKGVFILRIEDTDTERSTKEFDNDILSAFSWLGLSWDEGPMQDGTVKGGYGPYRQSERIPLYQKHLERLLHEQKAYYCFCTKDDLEAQRAYAASQGLPQKYAGTCARLSPIEIKERQERGAASVIRFRTPEKTVKFHDLIRGSVSFDTSLLGDMVIAKDERIPLYNFAVVIDDALMKISHVIRGEDHISNTPKQILLYEAFGFSVPTYAHVPLILSEDRSKLSKRRGAQAVTEYRREGYLPEAVVNFIAMLGWNPGTDQELFSLDELSGVFDIAKINASGAVFNVQKLDWFNAQYLRKKTPQELADLCLSYLIQAGLVEHDTDRAMLERVVEAERERMKKLSDIAVIADFFFKLPKYDSQMLVWKKSDKEKTVARLKETRDGFAAIVRDEFIAARIKEVLEAIAVQSSTGEVFWPVRAALSGKEASLGPVEIAAILGKEETIRRIDHALSRLASL